MSSRKRKLDLHFSSLTGDFEDYQHITPKRTKFAEINENIVWILTDGSTRPIENEELNNYVFQRTVPENVLKMSFENFCTANPKQHRFHMYSGSCLINGEAISELKLPVQIKISKMNCLGEREYNAAKKNTPGCVQILRQWRTGEWIIFVRQRPVCKLSELLMHQKPTDLDINKKIVTLGENINYLHTELKFFIRFIIPENIAFVGSLMDIYIEEFGTLSFMDKDSVGTSDFESSGDEYNKICSSAMLESLIIDDKPRYTVKNEICRFGELIQTIGSSWDLGDLQILGEFVLKEENFTMPQITTHPLLQTNPVYFSYISTVIQQLNKAGGRAGLDIKKKFDNRFRKFYGEPSALCHSAIRKLCNDCVDLNDKVQTFITGRFCINHLEALEWLHDNYSVISIQRWWHDKLAKSYPTRDDFNQFLRKRSIKFIIHIHQIVLHMVKSGHFEETVDLCTPKV